MNSIQKIESLTEQIWQEGMQFLGDFLEFQSAFILWNKTTKQKGEKLMREDKNETRWDKLLHIRTMGRDDSHSDEHRFPYEPTPYCVLERLANSGCIRKGNTVIDYGCGKGRVDFFSGISDQMQFHRCRV